MSTYTITFINSAMIDTKEYKSMKEAIKSAKFTSNGCGCDAVIKRDDGVDVVRIWHRYVDVNNKLHNTRVERLYE